MDCPTRWPSVEYSEVDYTILFSLQFRGPLRAEDEHGQRAAARMPSRREGGAFDIVPVVIAR
jgi:hypothetical protein